MSSIIKIKRSTTAGSVPSGLQEGELALNLFDRKIYAGNSSGVTAIGGEIFSLTSQTAGEGAYLKVNGETSSNSVLLRGGTGITVSKDANGSLSIVATGDAQAGSGTVGTASLQDGAVTAAKIAANGLTANTYGAKSVGTAAIADAAITSAKIAAGGITANAIGNDSVALGTKTTGNYVATISDAGAGDIVVSGSGSETAAVTLDLADSISSNTSGTAAQATVLQTSRNFSIAGDVTASAQGFDGSGNVTLTTTLAADSVDGTNIADDSIDSEHYVAGSIDAEHIASGAVTNAKIASDAVTLGTQTTGNYAAAVTGTTNEIEVTGSAGEGTTFQIGLPNDVTIANDLTVSNDLGVSGSVTIDGNLTVEGGVTYISSSTVNVDDTMLKLSANNVGNSVDHGVYAKYVDGATTKYSGYFRDASDSDVFKFYTGLQTEPTTTVDTGATGYTLAQIDAVIDGGTY